MTPAQAGAPGGDPTLITAERLVRAVCEGAPLKEVVLLYVLLTVERTGCNMMQAERRLRLSRRSIYVLLQRSGISIAALRAAHRPSPEAEAEAETILSQVSHSLSVAEAEERERHTADAAEELAASTEDASREAFERQVRLNSPGMAPTTSSCAFFSALGLYCQGDQEGAAARLQSAAAALRPSFRAALAESAAKEEV